MMLSHFLLITLIFCFAVQITAFHGARKDSVNFNRPQRQRQRQPFRYIKFENSTNTSVPEYIYSSYELFLIVFSVIFFAMIVV